MRRGVALYPLTPTILPVVMHWEQLQPDYRLASLLAPSGFSVAGHDAGHMLHLPDTGIRVDDRIDSRPEAWDILPGSGDCRGQRGHLRGAAGACQMGPFSRKSLFITSGEVLILSRMGCGSWLESTKAGCGSLHSGPRGRTSTPKRSCTASRSPLVFGGRPH